MFLITYRCYDHTLAASIQLKFFYINSKLSQKVKTETVDRRILELHYGNTFQREKTIFSGNDFLMQSVGKLIIYAHYGLIWLPLLLSRSTLMFEADEYRFLDAMYGRAQILP